jgi:cyanophycin synthetase
LTIRQLVDEVNKDPRRGDEHATSLSKIYLDGIALEVLREQGCAPETVLPAGQRALIRRNANLSTGGTAADVTDFVHPETAAHAVDAALAIGLDIAGVDVVAHNIGRPLAEQGGVVVEVNAGPGLRMHLDPSSGHPQPVGEAIVDMLFPAGHDGRIPLVVVLAAEGESKSPLTHLIGNILRSSGKTRGMTCAEGVYLDDRRLLARDGRDLAGAQALLLNPAVEAAVLEVTTDSILETGLGFDRADVVVVAGSTLAREPDAARALLSIVAPTGTAVVALDTPGAPVAAVAPACPGSVQYVDWNADQPFDLALAAHAALALSIPQATVRAALGFSSFPLDFQPKTEHC